MSEPMRKQKRAPESYTPNKPVIVSMMQKHVGQVDIMEAYAVKGSEEPMIKFPHLYMMFHVSNSTEAYELYYKAFGAEKISEDVLPQGDVYILMEVNGFQILVRPGEAPGQGCCVKFATEEDLRRAYDLLTQEGKGWFQDAHWTSLLAHVTDKFGVGWMLCV